MTATPSSGALSVEWRDITHHSADNAPLDERAHTILDERAHAVLVRGAPTSDEIAAVLAALTRRPVPAEDPYERWRRGRIAVRSRGADAR